MVIRFFSQLKNVVLQLILTTISMGTGQKET